MAAIQGRTKRRKIRKMTQNNAKRKIWAKKRKIWTKNAKFGPKKRKIT